MRTIKKVTVGKTTIAIKTNGSRFGWAGGGKKSKVTYSRARDAKRGAKRALKGA